jgi:hypothetical protein
MVRGGGGGGGGGVEGGAAGGSCYRHPLLWCWSNLQLAWGGLPWSLLYFIPRQFP